MKKLTVTLKTCKIGQAKGESQLGMNNEELCNIYINSHPPKKVSHSIQSRTQQRLRTQKFPETLLVFDSEQNGDTI
jgi:hypothetical protein